MNDENVRILNEFFTFLRLVSLESDLRKIFPLPKLIEDVVKIMASLPICEYDGIRCGFLPPFAQ